MSGADDSNREARVIAFEPAARRPVAAGYTRLRPARVRAQDSCTTDHDCPPDKLCEGGHCV